MYDFISHYISLLYDLMIQGTRSTAADHGLCRQRRLLRWSSPGPTDWTSTTCRCWKATTCRSGWCRLGISRTRKKASTTASRPNVCPTWTECARRSWPWGQPMAPAWWRATAPVRSSTRTLTAAWVPTTPSRLVKSAHGPKTTIRNSLRNHVQTPTVTRSTPRPARLHVAVTR